MSIEGKNKIMDTKITLLRISISPDEGREVNKCDAQTEYETSPQCPELLWKQTR